MVSGIDAAASGMKAQQRNLDVLANNLANINTTGFKQLIPVFKSLAAETSDNNLNVDSENSGQKPIMISSGCVLDATVVDLKQGALIKTDNVLDFALSGEGFFVVENNDKEYYTRNGNFKLNEDGILTACDGKPVLDESGGSINFNLTEGNFNDIKILEDGVVMSGKQEIGKLQIVVFEDPKQLISAGNSLFMPADKNIKPTDAENYRIEQGFIEGSNSNSIETMIKTITATRTYETLSTVLKTANNTLKKAVNDVGRVIR